MYLEKEAIDYFKNYELTEYLLRFSKGNEGFSPSRRIGSSSEFEEYKEYVPSDNPKDIDWKKYGRTEKFLTKQYESYSHLRVHFILDVSRSMYYPVDKFILAKKFIALFSYLLIKEQNEVFVSCIGENFIDSLKISSDGIESIFNSIELEKRFYYQYLYEIKERDINFLISDGWWGKDMDKIIELLIRKRINFLNFFSIKEWKLPYKNSAVFIDSESNKEIVVDSNELKKIYERKLEERKTFFYDKFVKNKLFYFVVFDDMPYYFYLKNILDSIK